MARNNKSGFRSSSPHLLLRRCASPSPIQHADAVVTQRMRGADGHTTFAGGEGGGDVSAQTGSDASTMMCTRGRGRGREREGQRITLRGFPIRARLATPRTTLTPGGGGGGGGDLRALAGGKTRAAAFCTDQSYPRPCLRPCPRPCSRERWLAVVLGPSRGGCVCEGVGVCLVSPLVGRG